MSRASSSLDELLVLLVMLVGLLLIAPALHGEEPGTAAPAGTAGAAPPPPGTGPDAPP